MKCKVCSREAQAEPQSQYCDLHQKAYESLQEKFEVWKKASNIDWESYLREIAKNTLTGTWAKEVAENLLSERNV
ncbi:MAG TPA: hypothetical protein VJ249_02345 [Candidatus Bathyarchaeia archaeon]|nr:hypothetical protein [Candidatus Bathyarchaeia archaeon]